LAGSTGEVQLHFRLNNMRFVCIFAPDNPVVSPTGQRAKVGTRNCAPPPPAPTPLPSLWNVRGQDNAGFQQIKKLRNNIDSSTFCIIENTQTSQTPVIELEVCEGVNAENWKLNRVQ
jgi:hypothetical protein